MPEVSIITVCYNHEEFIRKCIESVLAQSFRDWEQIVIDDGSTDKTADLVEQYSLNEKRIRLVRHEHLGVHRLSESYNTALAASRGKLIAVLEGDDYWPPAKLENQVSAFINEQVVLAWGKAIEVDKTGSELNVIPTDPSRYLRMQRGEAARELLLGCYIPAVTVICRRIALESVGGFKQPHGLHCTDYPTWLALLAVGDFSFLDTVLGYWAKHDGNVSSQFRNSTAWCNCAIDAFNAMPGKLKRDTGLSETRLIRNLQRLVDINITTDPKGDFTRPGFLDLARQQLERSTLQGNWPPVPYDLRRRDIQEQLARLAILRGRRLLREHRWNAARRNLRVAFEHASARDRVKTLVWIGFSLLRLPA